MWVLRVVSAAANLLAKKNKMKDEDVRSKTRR
jgi:hypothetical protein